METTVSLDNLVKEHPFLVELRPDFSIAYGSSNVS